VFIQRVLKTAKLKGQTGSLSRRGQVADKLCAKFSAMMNDTFELKEKAGQKAVVTKEEIEGFFKKLAPNVELDVIDADYSALGYKLSKDGDKKSIKGYCLKLPFSRWGGGIDKNNHENILSLDHEKRHFFTHITEPKYTANKLAKKLTPEDNKLAWNFYEKILYKEEFTFPNGSILKEAKATRRNFVKEKIGQFFKANPFPSDQKIEILKKWRYNLKDESKAFDSSLSSYWKNQSTSGKQESFIPKGFVENNLFFPEKIKIVEKMLAAEIAKVRATQKKLFS
jgi:hypothetical protein